MTLVNFSDIAKIRERVPRGELVICSGSFDIIHAGHALFFEDCKKQGKVLIVLVAGDVPLSNARGSKRPIVPGAARAKLIDSLEMVDYTTIDDFSHKSDDPYFSIKESIRLSRPDTYVINDDASDISLREQFSKDSGVKLIILPRTCPEEFKEISTSKIIDRVLDAYGK